jgi:hypothetical protein
MRGIAPMRAVRYQHQVLERPSAWTPDILPLAGEPELTRLTAAGTLVVSIHPYRDDALPWPLL